MAKINECWVCLDCDEVFSSRMGADAKGPAHHCPKCASEAFWPLGMWVKSDVRGIYGDGDGDERHAA